MILFISSSTPFENQANKELLDMVLAAGAFDLDCAILLQGNGVLQLRTHNSQAIEQKDINKTLHALPMYDIEPIFVLEDDLTKFSIDSELIDLDIKVLSNSEYVDLIDQASKVIRL